ncbi:MAG TPA: TolC family protein [Gemmatimonadales bacterium]|nr:TolC family protein [Gemmatimonadales bacterium]
MNRTSLVVLATLLVPLRLAAQERAITLAEAIRLAQRTQPSVVQAQGQVQTAAAQRRSAWGAFLPSLAASSSASDFFSEGASRIDPITGQVLSGNTSNRSLNATLRASVDLFTGFRRGADLRAARAGETQAAAGLVDARFTQDLATTNQFFDALSAAQLVSVRESSVKRAEEQLKVSVAKLQAGSATRSDSLRSLVTLGTTQLDLIQAQTDLATAEAGLARLVGETGRVRALDDSSFRQIVAVPDTAALRQEAETKSPRVQTALAGANLAQANLSSSRSAYWPSLTLGATTSWNGSRTNDYTFFNQRQVSLALSWDIFNGFDRELTIAQRQASLDVAEANATDERRAVDAALTQYLAALDAAQAKIGITATSVAAATEDLRVQQERYRLGASTIVDVLTSQEALNQAEVDVVNARFDYLRAKAQLEALIGRTL